ncbi:uncharacterized protein DEA37_0009242 [Paragonimus westermani]|uniref:Uncharacterized protein n=1 Tax=Paragonimus westermani TaxID=34504 RepID=A0A5J4NRE9_9TREM|nr:uncharacterized protein DEA37_0009242 [Paragonimus westermani]
MKSRFSASIQLRFTEFDRSVLPFFLPLLSPMCVCARTHGSQLVGPLERGRIIVSIGYHITRLCTQPYLSVICSTGCHILLIHTCRCSVRVWFPLLTVRVMCMRARMCVFSFRIEQLYLIFRFISTRVGHWPTAA